MDDAGVREIREHYRGEIATLRAEVDRLLNANRIMCDNYNAQDKLLTDEMKEVERLTEQLAAISRVMCGNDTFPGDLAQYVKNEVVGRRDAESQLAAVEGDARTLQGFIKEYGMTPAMTASQRTSALARVTALEEAGEAMRLDFGNPQTHERWRRVSGGGHELGM